jgi:hypothetical protein
MMRATVIPAKAGIQTKQAKVVASRRPYSCWASSRLDMPRMSKDRLGDDPTSHSFAGVTQS